MCGIAGYVNADGRPADLGIVERMAAAIAHRGPDGDGFRIDGPVALGHRRLAIIDVAGGAQPMANEDESVWITYNGELYNDPQIKAACIARGHRYRTACDTESIVHLYEDEPEAFATRLNGMFALAIWDGPRRRLTLARDRMGQKPLLWAELPGGGIAFGSEAKALLAHPEIARTLDMSGLARYLFYEYLPSPGSIWRGIRKLPAGHTLTWEGGRTRIERYDHPATQIASPPPFEAAAETFWGDLRASVARHMRSDVPLGVFLSGGVDSSSVAAALCEVVPPSTIRTYSIGFDDPSFDESSHAREVAAYLGTDHRERRFGVQTLLDMLPEVAALSDEPFGDASILPTHLLSKFAREEVTVALGGDGADELLAGYPTFAAERAAGLFRRLPGAARSLAGAMAGAMPVKHGNMSLDFKVKQFLRGASSSTALAHQRWLGSFDGPEIAALLLNPPEVDVEAEHLARAAGLGGDDALGRSLALYQDTYLPEDILTKVDRASMWCSLEVRAPFLDAELVATIRGLPSSYKYGKGKTKRLLKAAAADRLPDAILRRPKKGFGIPVAKWLRGPLSGMMEDLLGETRLRRQGIFRVEEVRRRVVEHREGMRDHRKPLWTLLMFQLWCERWSTG